MKTEFKELPLNKEFPCLMKNHFNQIVLVTQDSGGKKHVTPLKDLDKDNDLLIEETFESEIKEEDYSFLPKGVKITITN